MKTANWIATLVLAAAALAAWGLAAFEAWRVFSVPPAHLALCYALTAVACLGWVLTWLSVRRPDNETRCRKCGYILRGLTEPRCPECGERI